MFLFGASGHAKVVFEVIQSSSERVEVEAIFDDNPKLSCIGGVKVLPQSETILDTDKEWIISIGNNKCRKEVSERIKGRFRKALHKDAVISRNSEIGNGSVVMAGAVINSDARIGRHCIINTGAIVEHDCVIGDFVHISPKAALAGAVTIGEGTQVGIGAVIIQGITVGKWVMIGAGAVIIRDIPDFAVVVGNPGRIIKQSQP